jgi:hypothetical protein
MRASMGGRRNLLLILIVCGAARADEVDERLQFLEPRLARESLLAHAWQSSWAILDLGGVGWGACEIAQRSSRAELADGIVLTVKSLGGVANLALSPLASARNERELDAAPGGTPDERLRRLALAESLLARNALEADQRYAWRRHVVAMLINLAGGVVTAVAGDWKRGAQSAGLGLIVGELQLWTRPWQAKRDLRDYRRRFGGLASH